MDCVFTKKLQRRYSHHITCYTIPSPWLRALHAQGMPSRLKHGHSNVNRAAPVLPSSTVQRKVLSALYGNDPAQEKSLFFSIPSPTSPLPNLYFFSGLEYTFQLVSSCGSHFPLLGGELMRFSITSQRKGEGESNLMETDEVMPL